MNAEPKPKLIAQCKCWRAVKEHGPEGCTEPEYLIHKACPECGKAWSDFEPAVTLFLVMYETADAASIVFATADIEAARARRDAENLKMGMDAHIIEGWSDGFEEGIEVV